MCRTWILSAALLLISASSSLGIVPVDGPPSESAPSGSWDVNWDYVYNYKESSAVAIDSYWLLTAAHVADDAPGWNMTIGPQKQLPRYGKTFQVYLVPDAVSRPGKIKAVVITGCLQEPVVITIFRTGLLGIVVYVTNHLFSLDTRAAQLFQVQHHHGSGAILEQHLIGPNADLFPGF